MEAGGEGKKEPDNLSLVVSEARDSSICKRCLWVYLCFPDAFLFVCFVLPVHSVGIGEERISAMFQCIPRVRERPRGGATRDSSKVSWTPHPQGTGVWLPGMYILTKRPVLDLVHETRHFSPPWASRKEEVNEFLFNEPTSGLVCVGMPSVFSFLLVVNGPDLPIMIASSCTSLTKTITSHHTAARAQVPHVDALSFPSCDKRASPATTSTTFRHCRIPVRNRPQLRTTGMFEGLEKEIQVAGKWGGGRRNENIGEKPTQRKGEL